MKNHRCLSSKLLNLSFTMVAATGLFFFCQSADSKKTIAKSAKSTEKPAIAATSDTSAKEESATVKSQQTRKLVVYYFHGNFRCHSCTMIESLTKKAVNSGFTDQINNGRVEMRVINIEKPGKGHYASDYNLYTKSVILSDIKNGKEASWKNLEKDVWSDDPICRLQPHL